MAMREAGIALYGGNTGSADDAVRAFLSQTLVQNENPTCGHKSCIAEHGLSIYIETEKYKLLLDTGQTE